MNGECDGANDGEGAETSDGSSSTTPAMMMLLEDLLLFGYHCCFSRSYSHKLLLVLCLQLLLVGGWSSCRALGEALFCFVAASVRCDELRAVVPSIERTVV